MYEKEKKIPEIYFDNQEFYIDEIDEEKVVGILGKNPSVHQFLKFELCTYINKFIKSKELNLLETQEITGISASDINRIKNYHIERFTVDELIKIYTILDNTQCGIGSVLSNIGNRISKKFSKSLS